MSRFRRFRLRYSTYISLWGFTFALPAVIYLLLFNVYPMLNAFYLSFTRYDLIHPPEWYGLENFRQIFTSPQFRSSLQITFIYVFGTVIQCGFYPSHWHCCSIDAVSLLEDGVRYFSFRRFYRF